MSQLSEALERLEATWTHPRERASPENRGSDLQPGLAHTLAPAHTVMTPQHKYLSDGKRPLVVEHWLVSEVNTCPVQEGSRAG